ncbi:hypothetical protein CANMA_000541 [Candida margitis]|uniref:uncharacterized protein n=1 Tax=Candida margitis TaxID=1775924 RepID=UPI002227744C|nr:uncharacterized protein CANMA_000541 [Candida margitis]KAI5970378.1 hypothetical protein CANMA_000541 [Candida margitis]
MDIRTLTEESEPGQSVSTAASKDNPKAMASSQLEHMKLEPELLLDSQLSNDTEQQPRQSLAPSNENDKTSNKGSTDSPSPSPYYQNVQNTQATHDNASNSYSSDHDAHILNKPKRQRRSYSCGPCKMLKIKCDLQVPCTSCKKFKRVNRCLLQPPQPPSQEELSKIKERKKRTMHKRLKTSNDIVHAFNDNQNSIPSLLSSIQSSTKLMEQQSRSFHEHNGHQQSQHSGGNDNFTSAHIRQSHFSNLQPDTTNGMPTHPISHISSNYNEQPRATFSDENKRSQGDLIDTLISQDYQKHIELSMVDVKRIKRLLPSKFEAVEHLFDLYINTINSVFLDIQDHDEIMRQGRIIYNKLVSIDDDNVKNLSKSVEFNVVELRNLSLIFLILASGFLFENVENISCNFLFDLRTIYKDDLIQDWVKIAKFIKLKLLSYESLTDLIYLMDWYFIIKNLYTYDNMIVDNYLEFNNLLNYLVLNNDFIALIEDTGAEVSTPTGSPQPQKEGQYKADEVRRKTYSKSREFLLLGKYWIQLRMIELEFTFFQYKGSMLVSNQLKNSIVPHADVLEIMYGPNGAYATSALTKHQIAVWSLYYTRSGQSTSIRRIVKDYLMLYSNASLLLKDDLKMVEAKFCTIGENAPQPKVTVDDAETLLKNQQILLLFVRWLSFIRIESNYFPSLRYSSFLTTMINLNNHFNVLEKYYKDDATGGNLVDFILSNFPLHFIKSFLLSLTYQALFLIFLKYSLIQKSRTNVTTFKIRLDEIYNDVLGSFQKTLDKFVASPKMKEYYTFIPVFRVNMNFLLDANHILNEEPTTFQSQRDCNSQKHIPPLAFKDLTDLLYQLKAEFDPEHWEFLTNVYFGSRDNFFRYVEKVWDLFQFLLSNASTPGDGPGAQLTKDMVICNDLRFNDELIRNHRGQLMGLVFDHNVVEEYMRLNVEPNIDD